VRRRLKGLRLKVDRADAVDELVSRVGVTMLKNGIEHEYENVNRAPPAYDNDKVKDNEKTRNPASA